MVSDDDKASAGVKRWSGWVGVDLDGTLATYDDWRGPTHIGEPIQTMVQRVITWLGEGRDVRIFTARVSHDGTDEGVFSAQEARAAIVAWCKRYIGRELVVTNEKDYHMHELWDDRAVRVVHGVPCCNRHRSPYDAIVEAERLGVEHIIGVAVRNGEKVYQLGWPCRHGHVLHMLSQTLDIEAIAAMRRQEERMVQGFVTNEDRFVDRQEAAQVARAAGQTATRRVELFSEDVW